MIAAAPCTAARSPSVDARTSHGDHAAESHASSERTLDAVDEPRRQRAEASSEYDAVEVEEVNGRGECRYRAGSEARPSAASVAGSPALARSTRSPVIEALRSPAGVGTPGVARDRLLPDERLETATVDPHCADGPLGSTVDVPELAAETVRAPEELAVDEDAAADADLAEDADEARETLRRAPAMLGERGGVGLVLEEDRQLTWRAERRRSSATGDSDQSEVRRPQERRRRRIDEARDARSRRRRSGSPVGSAIREAPRSRASASRSSTGSSTSSAAVVARGRGCS